MSEQRDEVQERVCRACNAVYKYPVRRSLATRFHCEACVALAPEIRAAFEQFNKRIRALTTSVQRLEQRLSGGGAAPGRSPRGKG